MNIRTLIISLMATVSVYAISPTAKAEFKYGQTDSGFQTTTLCIPNIGYCSKPLLYKYEGNTVLNQYNAPFDIEQASTDMIIEACMHTDAYLDVGGSVIDCGKMQAAELGPYLGMFSKLYEAYVYETGGKAGSFKDIGMSSETDRQFFIASEVQNGATFTLKSSIHDCKKGSKWILIGKPTPDAVIWSLTEPNNATCKSFLKDGIREHFNSSFKVK